MLLREGRIWAKSWRLKSRFQEYEEGRAFGEKEQYMQKCGSWRQREAIQVTSVQYSTPGTRNSRRRKRRDWSDPIFVSDAKNMEILCCRWYRRLLSLISVPPYLERFLLWEYEVRLEENGGGNAVKMGKVYWCKESIKKGAEKPTDKYLLRLHYILSTALDPVEIQGKLTLYWGNWRENELHKWRDLVNSAWRFIIIVLCGITCIKTDWI